MNASVVSLVMLSFLSNSSVIKHRSCLLLVNFRGTWEIRKRTSVTQFPCDARHTHRQHPWESAEWLFNPGPLTAAVLFRLREMPLGALAAVKRITSLLCVHSPQVEFNTHGSTHHVLLLTCRRPAAHQGLLSKPPISLITPSQIGLL